MCRHVVHRTLEGLYQHPSEQRPCSNVLCGDYDELHVDGDPQAEGCDSPLAFTGLSGLPCSPVRVPSLQQAVTLEHESVQRCLFGSKAQRSFEALPRLIMPATPLSSCCGALKQLQTPPAPPMLERPVRKAQHKEQGLQEWLTDMEVNFSGGRSVRSVRASSSASDSPSSNPASAGVAGPSAAADLPPPAFALLGILQ